MTSLPPELWEFILIERRKLMWKQKKQKLHCMLYDCLLPRLHHVSRFRFRNHEVTFYRTPHIETTITFRQNTVTFNQVLLLFKNNIEEKKLETRFCYLPTVYIR